MADPEIILTPLGGGREIGANSSLLRWGGRTILLDAGLHPTREGYEALPLLAPLEELGALDALVVTHGHLDHVGALPFLTREFRPRSVFMTDPTVAVTSRMLHNTVSVMALHGYRVYGDPGYYEGHYSHRAVDELTELLRFSSQPFGHWFHVAGPVRGMFFEAGHVLGAGGIVLTDGRFTLVYPGDICLEPQEIHPGARLPRLDRPVDTILLESTYGGDPEAAKVVRRKEVARFARRARKVLNRGGSVLIPAFALGRTQEMLTVVTRLIEAGELPRFPIRVSGLGRAMNLVYDEFSHELSPGPDGFPRLAHGYGILEIYPRGTRWGPPDLDFIQHKVRRLLEGPSLIIATNGMMKDETPSAHFAEQMLQRREDAIFFVGYVDRNELGARVLEAVEGDEILFGLEGRAVRVCCRDIERFYFTAHAHREDLLRVAAHFAARQTVLVHGEPESVEWMRDNVPGDGEVFAPAVGATVELSGGG